MSYWARVRLGAHNLCQHVSPIADHPSGTTKTRCLEWNKDVSSLLGNDCALLSSYQQECQQNCPDDAGQDNIGKIPMNAVLPCFHSLDGHYRSGDQALAAAKAISERCNDGFLAASSRKGPSAINQLRNIGSHAFFISRSHLECARSV
jgi:hypothetical protein